MRALYVHAHPDDESIATGLSIAALAEAGHEVHVLTCTLGEQGEVIPPELAHLDADHDDTLGAHRVGELRAALAALGAHGHVLGATGARPSRYRDSGMAGSPSAARPDAFVNADPAEAIGLIREVLDALAPDVVVTYEKGGGYGHPDHIQAHRLTCAAIATMASPPPTYAVFTPADWAREDRAWVAAHVPATAGAGIGIPSPEDPYAVSVLPGHLAAVVHESPSALERQAAALRAHATQVTVYDGWFALSNNVAQRLPGREAWAVLDPRTGLIRPPEDPR
ncbi:MAG: N-acetyl-1-D-myo-inositol-2-amino-2-deoxy-alpha-D-glucopyranoside deacetylase [Tetrasphaera sp.]|jgi:N-acetyl-1-D-myo-inositol-2-amino-2-deoxy-alpha-D-glucopyranoside deacetylase|nr:N-acetyl-1-D-myo-inositol-2-amino-2-deoxy-alpha-D-glucopyranoside deacetylase [Tetrasphaera sp.]